MPEAKEYPPNTFCWPELATSDPQAAKKFYGGLMGWSFKDNPAGPDMVYTMVLKGDKYVGALYAITEEMKTQGVPPNWLSYVSVTNADETAKKAEELGGKIIKECCDVMDEGRMALLQDPAGAVFAIWQPKSALGAQLVNEHGALTWNELMTGDVDRAGKFYTDLFGWGSDTADMGGFNYTSFTNGERPAGGMMQIDPKTMGDVPPHWLVYFAVDDCDGAAETIKKLGGTVVAPPRNIPEVGRFCVAVDPQGAAFAVIKLLNPPA
ncbi:MAG: VOC family protein [Candidatus Krumholzibacteria bacterium]|nr:VOC family protein [Candidatus Krumholzibacteria bacterium]